MAFAGVKEALDKATDEEVKAAIENLSADGRAKIEQALAEDSSAAKEVEMDTALLETGQLIKHPYGKGGEEHRLYLPKSYDPSKRYPVILWMHGAGGVGNHHQSLRQALPGLLQGPTSESKALYEFAASRGVPIEEEELAIAKDFGFIVLIPMATPRMMIDQWPEGAEKYKEKYEVHEEKEDSEGIGLIGHVVKTAKGQYLQAEHHWEALRPRILELLDKTVENLGGDASRVYLCGMSVGGKGVLELAAALPERFAAVAACCAFFGHRVPDFKGVTPPLPPDAVKALTGMPLWLFHGKRDPIVQIANSRLIVDAMREANGENASDLVKFNEYDDCPSGGAPMTLDPESAPQHGVFEYGFRDLKLYPWLLQFKKESKC